MRAGPKTSPDRASAWMKASTTRLGERIYMTDERATGQMAGSPTSGSLMIELAKVEAALLGLPGRTTMVGRRKARPSTKPFRL